MAGKKAMAGELCGEGVHHGGKERQIGEKGDRGRKEDEMAGKRNREEKRREMSSQEELAQKEGKIQVRICGRERGLEIYERVKFVRVVSKRYNLLIMADYLPVIGELDGFVFFRDGEREYKREGLKGYFMHKKNQFSLMLKSESGQLEQEDEGGYDE